MKNAKNLIVPPSLDAKELSTLLKDSTDGLKRYTLLLTAWESGLFECTITPKTSLALSDELGGCHKGMLELFCDALVEIGLLKKQNNTYVNSSMTQTYLCQKSPYYTKYRLQSTKIRTNRWSHLSAILKNGPILQDKETLYGESWVGSIAEGAEMNSVSKTLNVVTAHLDAQRWRRLLDLGGGHGLYAIAFTALNPSLEAFVFDLPLIVNLTRKYVDAYTADRVHIIPGDFYNDDIGKGYDAIFSSFNQSCNDPALLPKITRALVPNGDLILHRFKEQFRKDALKTLDWSLCIYEGKNVARSSTRVGREAYLTQLNNSGFKVLGTFSVDDISEITFARKIAGL